MNDDERVILMGRAYRHFKGMVVITIAMPINTETSEKMVMYKCLTDGELYVRPYDMFISEVDHEKYPDVKQKYRFELIGNYEDIISTMIPDDVKMMIDLLKGEMK